MPTPQLVALRMRLGQMGPQYSACYAFEPVSQRVARSDLYVECEVQTIAYDRDALIEQLVEGKAGALYATVTLNIVDSYPPVPDQTIAVGGTIGDRFVDGGHYLMALQKRDDTYLHQFSFGFPEDYVIEDRDGVPTVSGLTQEGGPIPVNDAWKLIRSLFDSIRGTGAPAPAALLQDLVHGDFPVAAAALEVLSVTTPRGYTDRDLVEALENHYARITEDDPAIVGDYGPVWQLPYDRRRAFQRFALPVLKMLYPIASDATVQRLLTLYLHDREASNLQAFDNPEIEYEMVRLALKHPGPRRDSRVRSVFGRRVVFNGVHGSYGNIIVGYPRYDMLKIMAETPGDDIDGLLQDIFAHPENFGLAQDDFAVTGSGREELLQHRERAVALATTVPEDRLLALLEEWAQGRTGCLTAVALRMSPGDTSVFPLLFQGEFASMAAAVLAWKAPDPAILPVLRSTPVNQYGNTQHVIEALALCGAHDEGLALAEDVLASDFPETWAKDRRDPQVRNFYEDAFAREGALLALGTLGGDPAEILARNWLGAEADVYAEAENRAREAEKKKPIPGLSMVDKVRLAARLALTKMRVADAVELWSPVWEEGDTPARMTAAMALYYLGDNRGEDFVRAYARHAEAEVPEIYRYQSTIGITGEFEDAITYLRSPVLDTLFLDRIGHGLSSKDILVIWDASFELQHADDVLPLLIQHLNSRDPEQRKIANDSLEKLVGVDIGWDDALYPQPERLRQWRQEVDTLLALFEPVPTADVSFQR